MGDPKRNHMATWLQRATFLAAAVIAAAVVAAVLSGCGAGKRDPSAANQTDRGFVNDMTPHHRSAIGMAQIALKRAQHPQIRALAQDIVTAQRAEIALMGRLGKQLWRQGNDHATLAMAQEAMGMSMDDSELKTAKPFDRAFIDMMVPHHRGAITMAGLELDKGQNAATRRLAQNIIKAQSAEIEQMNQWRTSWYGAPVRESGGSMSSMSG